MRIFLFFISVFTFTYGFAEVESSQQTRYTQTFKQLNETLDLAKKITSEEIRYAVISELELCKKCLQSHNFGDIEQRTNSLNENIYEILADCDQTSLKINIAGRIEQMTEQLMNISYQ